MEIPEIHDAVADLKELHGFTNERIAMEAGVPYHWLQSFMLQRLAKPEYERVKKLIEWVELKRTKKHD